MSGPERQKFISTFLPGIILFVIAYAMLTIFRDFRDNFSAEVWETLGYGSSPDIYTSTEVPVSLAVLFIMGSIMLIKNNKLALMVNHAIVASGMILIGLSTFLFEQQLINPPLWMILIGLGLDMGYVPFNSIFFDRMIASFQYVGTVGFIMYVADSFGYLGSVSIIFLKEFGFGKLTWLNVFISSGYIISIAGTVMILGSMLYFHLKHQRKHTLNSWPVSDPA